MHDGRVARAGRGDGNVCPATLHCSGRGLVAMQAHHIRARIHHIMAHITAVVTMAVRTLPRAMLAEAQEMAVVAVMEEGDFNIAPSI